MRSRTDSRSGKTAPTPLEKRFGEIVVGSGRSQEPYIIAFHYASDNVTGSALGTLFGFFEVEIHDQDAAYIVNFLASVAKKEYFANPRRSPIESFEVALHKINVALAEIIKHGNVSWLGHLHGALGAVSDNFLNFSVTGEGELYLAREEAFHSISTGLAETGSEPHPLKTFTEVSSGELFDGDLVFALSPSIWSLFSPEDLRRSLNRLGPAGFEQFLRTALVNELPIAAVALLTCSAPVELQQPEKPKEVAQKSVVALDNVWSDAPFVAALQSKKSPGIKPALPVPEEKREEYTDQKTGHIYVQASPDAAFEPIDNPWQERWTLFQHGFETKLRAWGIASRKTARRIGKESTFAIGAVGAWLSLLRRSLGRKARSLKRTLEENRAARRHAREEAKRIRAAEAAMHPPEPEPKPEITAPVEPIEYETPASTSPEASEPMTPSSERVRRFFQREARPETTFRTEAKERFKEFSDHFPNLKPVLASSIKRIGNVTRDFAGRMRRTTLFLIAEARAFWQTRSAKERWVIAGLTAIVISATVYAALPNEEAAPVTPVVQETAPLVTTPAFPPANEPQATLLSASRTVLPLTPDARTITFASINNTLFLVTDRSITNLATQEVSATPEPIRLATAMDDLDSLFVLGASDTLYIYSVSTKQFAKNTLPITGKIDQMGAYLTYLYTLDRTTGNISRFPRAEGGFGTPTAWLKETVSLAPEGDMAVYENIALTLKNKEPALFSRGKRASVTFAGTTTLVTTDALAFDQKTGDILVLDRANQRIVRWSATGDLQAQYFNASFSNAETITLSPAANELLIADQTSVTAWAI